MEFTPTIAAFLTHVRVEKGLSANTVSAYRRDLLKFDAFARKRKLALETVRSDDLVDFLSSLYRQKLESRTVARHLVTLRNFFRFAQVQELIAQDPSLNLESPKIRRSLPGYLRLEEVEKSFNPLKKKPPSVFATVPCSKFSIPRGSEFPNSSAFALWMWIARLAAFAALEKAIRSASSPSAKKPCRSWNATSATRAPSLSATDSSPRLPLCSSIVAADR